MNRLVLLTGALALVAAAGPSYAALDGDVALNGACAAPAGATVLVPGAEAVEKGVTPPVGALNLTSAQAGTFVVDLAGLPVETVGSLSLTLSWDNPVTDYDLVVDGANDLSTDNPEVKVVDVAHCTPVDVDLETFIGAPVDEVTLAAEAQTVEQ